MVFCCRQPKDSRCKMTENHHPHDRFFKQLFSRPEVSRDFLSNCLLGEITELPDLTSLELTRDSC